MAMSLRPRLFWLITLYMVPSRVFFHRIARQQAYALTSDELVSAVASEPARCAASCRSCYNQRWTLSVITGRRSN